MKFYCENCKTKLEEEEFDVRVSGFAPYGNSSVPIYVDVCPYCGSSEIEECFKCDYCDEYYLPEEIEYKNGDCICKYCEEESEEI